MRIAISTTLVVMCLTSRVSLAQAPRDTVALLKAVAQAVGRIGVLSGPSIWPDFRPDTIPLVFVVPTRGVMLTGWQGALPAGFAPIVGLENSGWRNAASLGAASTASELGGRRVAQVVVSSMEPAMLVATAVHEAFHVFQATARTLGRKFGTGENSILVSTYPVFDVDNEAAVALEGKLLASALAVTDKRRLRVLAQEIIAVRRARQARLSPEFSDFEELSELNEGLAEYALVRALELQATEGPGDWRAAAARALASRKALLESLTDNGMLSLRFRYYQTGPALAQILDRLAGQQWKSRMVSSNGTLRDMLAAESDLDAVAQSARSRAESRFSSTRLHADAARNIEQLKTMRRAKADSLLSQPGVQLVLSADSLPGQRFNACGYDPQNLLQVSAGVRIQMRWWKPCAGGPTNAEFNVPSVYDEPRGIIRAIIGEAGDVKLTSNGQALEPRDGEVMSNVPALRLDSPRATVQAVRADLLRTGTVIRIYPKPAAPGAQ